VQSYIQLCNITTFNIQDAFSILPQPLQYVFFVFLPANALASASSFPWSSSHVPDISARIDYSLDLQILNNNHRPDGGSPIFITFGTSFKVRKVARKMASQFLLIFQRHLYHVILQLHSSDNITVDGEPSGSH
jgi:hypothetical protein